MTTGAATTTKGKPARPKLMTMALRILVVITVVVVAINTQSYNVATAAAAAKNNKSNQKSRRKFVSYTPSKWEQMWLDNVNDWTEEKKICQVILQDQAELVHDFLTMTCTSMINQKWCKMDDAYRPIYYNLQNRSGFDWTFNRPAELEGTEDPPPKAVIPGKQHEHIVSKFVFLDEVTGEEYVEYIEPLVSHLRHPLSQCNDAGETPLYVTVFRGYVIPPPSPPRGNGKKYYFDAGASSWNGGNGGPSLKYFTEIWGRHDISFDEIYAYEMSTPKSNFYGSVPPSYKKRTRYRQCAVSSSPETETKDSPFIPHEIAQVVKDVDDYVLFKLDIDSSMVEDGSINYILNNDVQIDEIVWEHHVHGNYLMVSTWSPSGNPLCCANMTLKESYDYFLKMRQKGIRAHSWV